jgi:predicted nucleic-acid-binding Zn-ribbon protein
MREMNLQAFKDFSSRGEAYERFNNMITVIEKFVREEDIVVFYPKYLFVNDKKLEVHNFMNDKVIIFYEGENDLVNIKVLKYNQISIIELKYQELYQPKTLNISFSSGDKIVLTDKSDTNSTWIPRFTNKVEQAFKLLTQ